MKPARSSYVSYAEYLRIEADTGIRHEWLDGEVFAMAGGTPEHCRLITNVSRLLGNALDGRPCAVFASELKIRVQATGLATYPDVAVVCRQLSPDAEDRNAATNPIVLVEVLSASTEQYDRADKWAHYRRIPSLQEYVLVSQTERRIEVFRRGEGGRWELSEWREGAAELHSLDVKLPVGAVYHDPLAATA